MDRGEGLLPAAQDGGGGGQGGDHALAAAGDALGVQGVAHRGAVPLQALLDPVGQPEQDQLAQRGEVARAEVVVSAASIRSGGYTLPCIFRRRSASGVTSTSSI